MQRLATCDELQAGRTSRGMSRQSKRLQYSSCRTASRGAKIEVVNDADRVLRWLELRIRLSAASRCRAMACHGPRAGLHLVLRARLGATGQHGVVQQRAGRRALLSERHCCRRCRVTLRWQKSNSLDAASLALRL